MGLKPFFINDYGAFEDTPLQTLGAGLLLV